MERGDFLTAIGDSPKKGKLFLASVPFFLCILVSVFLVISIVWGLITMTMPNSAFAFGYKFGFVSSNSMEPTIPNNSVILIREVEFNTIRPNDIITFDKEDRRITHRVLKVDETLTTKGDNIIGQDRFKVERGDVVGRFVLHVSLFPILMILTLSAIIFFSALYILIALFSRLKAREEIQSPNE